MSYTIKNKSGHMLVCDLKSGTTLRLLADETKTVPSEEITPYLKNLAKSGDIILRKVVLKEEKPKVVVKNTKTNNKKVKEEK